VSRNYPPAGKAAGAQLAAGVICFGLTLAINRNAEFNIDITWVLVAQGILAALITWSMALPRWWLPIQLLLPAGIAAAMTLDIPSWIYLALFFVIWTFYANATREGVPLYLTNRKTWAALATLLPDTPGARCIDLGSGLSGTTLFLMQWTAPTRRHLGAKMVVH
jgi:hypothetical protein